MALLPFRVGGRELAPSAVALEDDGVPPVLVSNLLPAGPGAVRTVDHGGVGHELEPKPAVLEAISELDVLGARESFVESARGDHVRTPDGSIGRVELPRGRTILAASHRVVLLLQRDGLPAKP